MNFDVLLGTAPERKSVLIVNSDTPGIDNLRWKQLALRMVPQPVGVERSPHHPVELREVPTGLFVKLFTGLGLKHSAAVAIACLHQTEEEQVLVCTQEFFRRELNEYIVGIEVAAIAIKSQLNEMLELILHLDLLTAAEEEEVDAVG